MRMLTFALLSLATLACAPLEQALISERPLPEKKDLPAYKPQYDELKERLLTRFLEDGHVISRQADQVLHQGDAILWTALSLAALPCQDAKKLWPGIQRSIKANKGMVTRYHPLPEKLTSDPTSRDMEMGFIFGLNAYYQKCPEAREQITRIWHQHALHLQSLNWSKLAACIG